MAPAGPITMGCGSIDVTRPHLMLRET